MTSTIKKTLATTFIALVFLFSLLPTARAEISAVATINPIHGLAAAVMEGIAEPKLLVTGSASVHGYQLKPSDARILERADAVIWISPNLETFMIRVISTLSQNAAVLELSEVSGLTLLEHRESADEHGHDDEHHEMGEDEHAHHDEEHDEHAEHKHDEDDHDDEHDHHDHAGGTDMHVWLDVGNAKLIAGAIAELLSETHPQYHDQLHTNLTRVLQKLDTLETELKSKAALISDKPYIVFHDAYQYLEKSLGLRNVGAVTVSPERAPGARKIGELKETIHRTGAVCAFAEPQFNDRVLRVVTEDTEIRMGTLDPLGANIEPGPEAYFDLMRDLVNSLSDCLG